MPVPGVAVLRDAALPRRAECLVDRQRRHGRVVTPQPFAGEDEVQVEVHEQPEQQWVRLSMLSVWATTPIRCTSYCPNLK